MVRLRTEQSNCWSSSFSLSSAAKEESPLLAMSAFSVSFFKTVALNTDKCVDSASKNTHGNKKVRLQRFAYKKKMKVNLVEASGEKQLFLEP